MVAVSANNGSVIFQTLMYVLNQSIIQDEGSYNYYFMKIGKGESFLTFFAGY